MLSGTHWFLVGCALLASGMWLLRRRMARRGRGVLAQREFRARHGLEVVRVLGGQLDPQRRSPWIEFYLGGRPARLVAAPLDADSWQAGVQLMAWRVPVQVWHARATEDGGEHDIDAPAGVDLAEAERIATRLAGLGVDNVASPNPDAGHPHVMRLRFESVEQLRDRLEHVAPLLDALEQLQAPND